MYPHTKQLILKKMEEGFYPGVAVAFIKENQVETFTAGFAQVVPEKQLMTEDLLFDAASLTKVVATTSLVLRLLEDGKIELDQPLHKYLPEFENQTMEGQVHFWWVGLGNIIGATILAYYWDSVAPWLATDSTIIAAS